MSMIAAVAALTLAASATLGPMHTIARASARGPHAQATAHGYQARPAALSMRVGARPAQRFRGWWVVICTRRGVWSERRATVAGATPFARRLPIAERRPDGCVVTAEARLARSGIVTVTLSGRER
jgi:hypothetical protein